MMNMPRLFTPALIALLCLGWVISGDAGADDETATDPFEAIRFMVGSWSGSAEGRFGRATVERSYRFVLDGAYLHEQSTSTYPPQEKNPAGEVHDSWNFFSFDRGRRLLVLRQFHDETIVNEFAVNKALSDQGGLVFDSEHIENFGGGWRAREEYEFVSTDEFVERFYLAAAGEDFELAVTTRLSRHKDARAGAAPR